ncbi:hypothetical protein BDV18DRAFT_159686 [Aspergillus unguis]
MGLNILIVGGGIAGLATALALRKAGHRVKVFEATRLEDKDTVGPVVHLGPRSHDLLVNWGYDSAEARAVPVQQVDEFNLNGQVKDDAKTQPPGWVYLDRSRLHRSLLNALSTDTSGQVDVLLGTTVDSVDKTGLVTLRDGSTFQGDVVVGADGFDSTVRESITPSKTIPSGPAQVAVYFSIPSGSHSCVQRFQHQPARYEKWLGSIELRVHAVEPDRLLFDTNLPLSKGDIDGPSLKQTILEAFAGASEFSKLLSTVHPEDIHFWTQPVLPLVEKWTSKHVVLVGDAAHPFLPHELPGTSQALNDAAALAAELSPNIKPEEVERALKGWEGPRKERVRVIQGKERATTA